MRKCLLYILLLCLIFAFNGYSQNKYDLFNINRAEKVWKMADSLHLPTTRLIVMYGDNISITYKKEKHYITDYYKYDNYLTFEKTEKEKLKKKKLLYKIFNETETMCKTQYVSDNTIIEKSTHLLDAYCFFYFALYKDGMKICESNQAVIGLKDYDITDYMPLNNKCFSLLVKLIDFDKGVVH